MEMVDLEMAADWEEASREQGEPTTNHTISILVSYSVWEKSKHDQSTPTKIKKFNLYLIPPILFFFFFAVELFAQVCHQETTGKFSA